MSTQVSRTASTGLDPFGGTNAYIIENTGAGTQLGAYVTITNGLVYTVSFYARRITGTGNIKIRNVNNAATTIILTNEWQRFSETVTSNSTTGRAYFNIDTTGDKVEIFGAQLEEQTQAETSAKTTGLPVTIDLFTENNYGTMTNMSASDIVEDTP